MYIENESSLNLLHVKKDKIICFRKHADGMNLISDEPMCNKKDPEGIELKDIDWGDIII